MKLAVTYIIPKEEGEFETIDLALIKRYMRSGVTIYKFSEPVDKDYLLTVEDEKPNASAIIVFKISDASIPANFGYQHLNPRILNKLEDDEIESEEYRRVDEIHIAEIVLC